MGIVGRNIEVCPLRRSMGGCSLAGVTVVCHLDKLVHTSHDNRFVHRIGTDRVELYRAVGLRREYGRFSDRINYFSSVLDLALGPGWSCAFYSDDSLFGSDRTTRSAA